MQDPHAHIAQEIVEALQAERKRRGWSQETLAVAAGVSDSCIRHLEKGRSTPTLVTLLKISSALGVDLSQILKAAQHETETDTMSRAVKSAG